MLKSRGSVHCPGSPVSGSRMSASPLAGGLGLVRLDQMVCAVTLVGDQRFDERVVERLDVTGGHPDLARQDDRTVQTDDVLAAGDHRLPPLPLDVLLELD